MTAYYNGSNHKTVSFLLVAMQSSTYTTGTKYYSQKWEGQVGKYWGQPYDVQTKLVIEDCDKFVS